MEPKPKKKKMKKILYANVTHTKYPIVKNSLLKLGYQFTESTTKNLLVWGDCEGSLDFVKTLEKWQFYNHFPGMWKIAHKVELVRNFDRLQKVLPEFYTFHPKSFILPFHFSDLKSCMSAIQKRKDRTFIIKPDKGSQGKGIFLIQDFDDLNSYWESAVAQQYIAPFLVDGFKFDLRIYVLVTSLEPLRVYIHQEGMARFCTEQYSPPTHSNKENSFAQLTNFSLNKKNDNFNDRSKRSKSEVFNQIAASGINIQNIQDKIDDIIRFTIISNLPNLIANYKTAINVGDGKSRLFEILGFDILLDSNADPWLIEVNSMPSLTAGSEFDLNLKTSVVEGALRILDLKSGLKKQFISHMRKEATRRMSGVGKSLGLLFDPNRETEISKTTNWRLIYPIDNEEIQRKCEIALEKAKEAPIGGVNETAASRMRREANKSLLISKSSSQISTPQPVAKLPIVELDERLESAKNEKRTKSARQKQASLKRSTSVKSIPSKLQSDITETKSDNSIILEEAVQHNRNMTPISKPKPLHHFTPKPINDLSVSPIANEKRPSTSTTRTPRSVILANEARMKKIQAKNNFNAAQSGNSIMSIFSRMPNFIRENEERERLLALKKRESECLSLNLYSYLIGNVCSPSRLAKVTSKKMQPAFQPIEPINNLCKAQILKLSVPALCVKSCNNIK